MLSTRHYHALNVFQEQIEWAVEEKADYIIGETFDAYGEAKLALDAILKYGGGQYIQFSLHAISI